jgi:glycosyltransferase involved in cell wall biosynthesis
MKKRVAVWLHGGIGTGHFSQGYPVLDQLLIGLSQEFEIIIYSKAPLNEGYVCSNFIVRSATRKIKNSIVRWLLLASYFLKDHHQKKFQILFAFWGYPTGFLMTLIARAFRIPSAVYLLGSDAAGIASINFGILHKPWTRRLAVWTYNNTSCLLAISQFQKDHLADFLISPPIKVVPWGAKSGAYTFASKTVPPVLRIIHVGHLSLVKDQATLLRAFALIVEKRPAELRIFGGDELQGAIQRLCRELKIERYVHFMDIIPYSQMPEQYAWADMMLHTSRSEGQSMALTEAAASGVLLAGTKVGLLYDLGKDCGIVVDVGEYKALSQKVLDLLEQPGHWKQKIANARAWSESHDLEWTIREVSTCLNSLLSEPKK